MSKAALIEKLEERITEADGDPVGEAFNAALWLAIDLVRQHAEWLDEPAEEVSVTAIAVKASGGEKAWKLLSTAQRQERLENARDVIAATGFVPRHDYWQDISTAPKDGTAILAVSDRRLDPPCITMWKDNAWRKGECAFREPYWYYAGLTHWMPIAASPKPE